MFTSDPIVNSPAEQLVGPFFDYGINDYLENLCRFNVNPDNLAMLQGAMEVNKSFAYFWNPFVYPMGETTTDLTIAGYNTRDSTITIAPYSFLLGINYYSSRPEGIKFSLFDKSAQMYAFDPKMVFAGSVAGTYAGNAEETGIGWMLSPLAVTRAGQIQISITNLSASSAIVQLMFLFASPINRESTSQNQVPSVAEGGTSNHGW